MKPRWAELNERERIAFQQVYAFLRTRLEERQTITWALRLSGDEKYKRAAVLDLIDRPSPPLPEPWRSAWRLIEEFWDIPPAKDIGGTGPYLAQRRIQGGDRSGSLVELIVNLVGPQLDLQGISDSGADGLATKKPPKSIHDVFYARLSSGTYIGPDVLRIDSVNEQDFLASLANALAAAIARALDCARRIGWDGKTFPRQMGSLHRVYHVTGAAGDPDKYHRGIAPSVKLLHEVIRRLSTLQSPYAVDFSKSLITAQSPIHLRLWCALARDATLATIDEVSAILSNLGNDEFWSTYQYPEIAELRAARFHELTLTQQQSLASRIRRRSPRAQWSHRLAPEVVERHRTAQAITEFRRIQLAGGTLSQQHANWMQSQADAFPELVRAARIEDDLELRRVASWASPNPDRTYDSLTGIDRLNAVETALSNTRGDWNNSPAERAADWLQENDNALKLVTDLEALRGEDRVFPHIMERIGWTHSPSQAREATAPPRDLAHEATRFFFVLAGAPASAVREAIDGVANWLFVWNSHLGNVPLARKSAFWLQVWPDAVSATNAREVSDDTTSTSDVIPNADTTPRIAMDSLNTPTGKLVGAFLGSCPIANPGDRPFDNPELAAMRNALAQTLGRSKLISFHRLIEFIPYFLQTDLDWANRHLVAALNADTAESLELWHAVGRKTRFREVLAVIGESMVNRVLDIRLDRETRKSLAFSLVVECLYALNEDRAPAVAFSRVQQMLRLVDDEVRAHAADGVVKFIEEVPTTTQPAGNQLTSEVLFERAGTPFLRDVWPQERSLATAGVSRHFSSLPATAGGFFSEAVHAISRFLIPFDCWSMFDYGFQDNSNNQPDLRTIDSAEKAEALLQLLDVTIGSSEASVVPYDLAIALQRIREIEPRLAEERRYRRLAALARRA